MYLNISRAGRTYSLTGIAAAIFTFLVCFISVAAAQTTAKDEVPLPAEVLALTNTFNDDAIPFNDQLVVLGKADAPLSSVLVFGLSGDASDLINNWLPRIVEKYVATGKMKVVVIDFPLTWHDMQALAGFRCVPANQHWDLLKESVRFHAPAYYMKRDGYGNAPDHIWRMMKDFGIPRDKAEKCMRNNAIVGHIEAQRRIVVDTWKTDVAPTFVVGDRVLINPGSIAFIEEAIEVALKGGK